MRPPGCAFMASRNPVYLGRRASRRPDSYGTKPMWHRRPPSSLYPPRLLFPTLPDGGDAHVLPHEVADLRAGHVIVCGEGSEDLVAAAFLEEAAIISRERTT